MIPPAEPCQHHALYSDNKGLKELPALKIFEVKEDFYEVNFQASALAPT